MRVAILILIMITTAAAGYTDIEKRDMKYLKLEGRAAKESLTKYTAAYTQIDIKLQALTKKQLTDTTKLKSYYSTHRCKGFTCKHLRAQSCYKVRTQINKLRALIRKDILTADKYKKEIATAKKFASVKQKVYNSCLKKYKALLTKG